MTTLADWITTFGPGLALVALIRALWLLTDRIADRIDRRHTDRQLEHLANQHRKEKP